jgi:hypothetical protein
VPTAHTQGSLATFETPSTAPLPRLLPEWGPTTRERRQTPKIRYSRGRSVVCCRTMCGDSARQSLEHGLPSSCTLGILIRASSRKSEQVRMIMAISAPFGRELHALRLQPQRFRGNQNPGGVGVGHGGRAARWLHSVGFGAGRGAGVGSSAAAVTAPGRARGRNRRRSAAARAGIGPGSGISAGPGGARPGPAAGAAAAPGGTRPESAAAPGGIGGGREIRTLLVARTIG